MNTRLVEIVGRLKRPRVFVLGDLILDKYVWGSVSRISPEAPVPVVKMQREEYRPGGASNVVTNLSALGAAVACGGVVGRDESGSILLRLLKAKSRTAAVVRDAGKPTSLKIRMMAHHQQMLRVDQEQSHPIPAPVQARLLAAALREAATSDLAIISDYSKGTLPPELCQKFIRRAGCPVLVGLKGHDHRKYAKATGASLNRSELRALTLEDDVDRGARKLMKELALKFLVVTLGEKGMRVYSRDAETIVLPTVARQVFDVTGAGDTALAAFGVGLASKLSLEECAILSTSAAGIVVGKVGTETATREELVLSASHGEDHRKIVTLPALLKALEGERAKGRKIVFTNGCFDLVHAGHAASLQFARSKGDVLVVGLNSDRSTRGLKGEGRPVVPQGDRARLLAAFEAVDYVCVFDQPTPAELVKRVKPDVLVKGEDYKGKDVVGSRDAGRVELAPLVKGISTSEIIRRIRQL